MSRWGKEMELNAATARVTCIKSLLRCISAKTYLFPNPLVTNVLMTKVAFTHGLYNSIYGGISNSTIWLTWKETWWCLTAALSQWRIIGVEYLEKKLRRLVVRRNDAKLYVPDLRLIQHFGLQCGITRMKLLDDWTRISKLGWEEYIFPKRHPHNEQRYLCYISRSCAWLNLHHKSWSWVLTEFVMWQKKLCPRLHKLLVALKQCDHLVDKWWF